MLMALLTLNVFVFKDDASYGPNQLALILSAVTAILLGIKQTTWSHVQEKMVDNVKLALGAIFILLLIGALIGTWVLSGIVPALVYYGLNILSPQFFLISTCLICTVVSIATGSSWSTSGTIGVALLGVGKAMGISPEMTIGAVISGAYFGDKLSPLSDTTNLAAAMGEVPLFSHIRYMLYTTVPSILITLVLFLFLGFDQAKRFDPSSVEVFQGVLSAHFFIHPVLFLVPVIVVVLIAKKMPTLAVLFFGMFLAGILAILCQSNLIHTLSDSGTYLQKAYKTVVQAAMMGIDIDTGNAKVNDLVSAKGMVGMLNTVWLIICAMIFGGAMEATGMLARISSAMLKGVSSAFGLVFRNVSTCLFFNVTASDQYLAVVVPGKMFKKAYSDLGLDGANLTRTLEDSGTVTSVLVPWNTCGAYHAALFGLSTWAFLPFCFFNLLSPLMTLVFAFFNLKIKRQ